MQRLKLIGILALCLCILATQLVFAKSINYVKCKQENFKCIKVQSGQSWRTLFPDDQERALVQRLNHSNGYTYKSQIIKVPEQIEYVNLLDFSPFPLNIKAPDEKIIVFDPQQYAWAAYNADGELIKWGPATGGALKCRGQEKSCYTKPGEFRLYSLGSSTCASSKYPKPNGGAPMPYCMFFNGGQAFHGFPGGVKPANVSHGCVRMFVRDAEWLRYDFAEGPNVDNQFRGTRVVILPYKGMDNLEEDGMG